MAKLNSNSKGPGSFLVSAILVLVFCGAVFAFGKANNINSAASLIDWTRSASEKLKGCMQPEIKFWTCSSDIDFSVPKTDGSGSKNDSSKDNGGSKNDKPTSADATMKKLASIKVGSPNKVDYDRGQWKHWVGSRCNDTRQQVLKEQAVSYKLDSDKCKVKSGKWIDPYTGQTFTDPSKLDIDHVYALGAAAKNGGNDWPASKKEQFANDKSHLLAVSASANRAKSDKNPADWWPENSAYSCDFATKYVNVASKYSLQFSKADVRAIEKGLKTCR